jgi:hypothetical protein
MKPGDAPGLDDSSLPFSTPIRRSRNPSKTLEMILSPNDSIDPRWLVFWTESLCDRIISHRKLKNNFLPSSFKFPHDSGKESGTQELISGSGSSVYPGSALGFQDRASAPQIRGHLD